MNWYKKTAQNEVKAQVLGQKLAELGLQDLGTRHAKAGSQFGTAESARRIAIGARDMMLNYLYAESDLTGTRFNDGSRWNMFKQYSIKQIYELPNRDGALQKAVNWVKSGPTMKEVRAWARAAAQASPDERYGRRHGCATGLENGPKVGAPADVPPTPPTPAPGGAPATPTPPPSPMPPPAEGM